MNAMPHMYARGDFDEDSDIDFATIVKAFRFRNNCDSVKKFLEAT